MLQQQKQRTIAKYKLSFSQEQSNNKFEDSQKEINNLLIHVDENGLWISYYFDNKQIVIVKVDKNLNVVVSYLLCRQPYCKITVTKNFYY